MPKKSKKKSLKYFHCDLSNPETYENVEIDGYAENKTEAKELMKKEIINEYTEVFDKIGRASSRERV